jgi:hypothetical protein
MDRQQAFCKSGIIISKNKIDKISNQKLFMKQSFLFILCLSTAILSFAQKKLVPVQQSTLTGIGLPTGSKQDSRMFSVAGARMLLEMESKKKNAAVSSPEVLVLPPVTVGGFNADSLVKNLSDQGWTISVVEEDNKYAWLQKDSRNLIMYFSMNSKETGLYFAESNLPPANNNTVTNQNNTVIDQQTDTSQIITQTKTQVQQTSINNNSPILGSWGKSNTVSQVNNRFGSYSYNKQQYTFNADGSYYFNAKNYSEQYSETLLIKESGTYVISGSDLIITPTNSVIEAWTKKNGGDNWNQLKSRQNRNLENASYQFSIVNNNLQLQIANPTERDGNFNSGNMYSYGPPGTFTPIKLPE